MRETPFMQGMRRWVAANTVAAITLAGLLLFGIVRLANGLFYSRLGLTPEEVGIGYQETLAQWTLPVLVATLSFLLIFLGGAWFLSVVMPRLVPSPDQRYVLPSCVALAIVFGVGSFVLGGWVDGSRAKRGVPVGTRTLFGIAVYPTRAESADVVPAADRRLSELGVDDAGCILYLGEAGGTVYLYAFDGGQDEGRVLRIPSGLIAVATPSARDACPDE